VRIPIPVVALLCLCVVGGVWWFGTRSHNFLTPPPESELAAIRAKVEFSLPRADHPDDVISTPAPAKESPTPPPTEGPKPAIKPDSPPSLAEYHDLTDKSAAHLMDLAGTLETEGEFQRALLAWERVLDSTTADETQTRAAIAAIKRLQAGLSDWNADPAAAIAITLHAGTGKSIAAVLTPVLEEIARELEKASSGVLKVTASVASGHDIPSSMGPAPVAIWLAGPASDSLSTEVLSFTVGPPESLRADVHKTLFQLVRGYTGRTASLSIPAAMADEAEPLEIMQSHITRLAWLELATRLNKPVK
jgi:hypothetical protein